MDILAQDAALVKGQEHKPILLGVGIGAWLVVDEDEPMNKNDDIPFDGRPGYGPEHGPADVHGLEARY